MARRASGLATSVQRFCMSASATLALLLAARGIVSQVFDTGELNPEPLSVPPTPSTRLETPVALPWPAPVMSSAPSQVQALHQLPLVQGCRNCCSEDDRNAPCLDVESCAAAGPAKGHYAMALSHWGRPSEGMLGSIKSMRAAADLLGQTDLIMVMLKSDAESMTPRIEKLFQKWGIKLHTVDWDVPPDMKHHPKTDWCGHQDLIRLHVLGLEGYDAVAYFDGDCEFQGDITPMMRCAASGKFLSTSGGMGEALNVGFFATRPDRRLVQAAVFFARENAYDHDTGWGGVGWAPNGGYYVGGECGQGFFYTLFYRKSEGSRRALQSVGLWESFQSAQLDRCIWNYQTDSSCVEDLDCRHVRVHHKPTRERGSERECDKLKFRKRREKLLLQQYASRPPPSEQELRWAKEGHLLKHSAGLCLRPVEEGETTLMLLSCAFPPEDNFRIVPQGSKTEFVLLKQNGKCAHSEGDEDPEMMPKEPKVAFPVSCEMAAAKFRKLPSKAVPGGFLLRHETGSCIHPYEGQEDPRPNTDLILHSDCNQDRKALTFIEDGSRTRSPTLRPGSSTTAKILDSRPRPPPRFPSRKRSWSRQRTWRAIQRMQLIVNVCSKKRSDQEVLERGLRHMKSEHVWR
ncbi:unnamed protein product [Effrenium voratum]|nr:unnamed protein product [Effrenium voratum]